MLYQKYIFNEIYIVWYEIGDNHSLVRSCLEINKKQQQKDELFGKISVIAVNLFIPNISSFLILGPFTRIIYIQQSYGLCSSIHFM